MANWDFKHADTKTSTHSFHLYPAMMIPQVAEKLIKEYGKKSNILFDPYCGTGTSLVEANLAGINAIGTDLNPLARLISRTKTTPIEIHTLELHIKEYYDYLFKYRLQLDVNEELTVPNFFNIDYWFSSKIIRELTIIKNYINKIDNISVKNFFCVAFSQTIRNCSKTRSNEFKLYRKSSDQLRNFKPEALNMMDKILAENWRALKNYMVIKNNNSFSEIYNFNTVVSVPDNIIVEKSIDLIVTSPPYGDSQSTVAYGQFSRLTNQWLGYSNPNQLDSRLMGGKRTKEIIKFDYRILNNDIKNIAKVDPKRALDVCAFYNDYEKSILNISKVVKKKGFVCFVVSNRCVKNVTLRTDEITKQMFENNNFKHINTFRRAISNKRLPRKNSPTGTAGNAKDLMNTEYIVILQKI